MFKTWKDGEERKEQPIFENISFQHRQLPLADAKLTTLGQLRSIGLGHVILIRLELQRSMLAMNWP